MKKTLMWMTLGLLAAGAVMAQESGWMLRARAVQMKMEDNGTNWPGLDGRKQITSRPRCELVFEDKRHR